MTALPHTQQNNPAPPARPEVQRRSPQTASSDAANPERKSRAEPFREESSLFDALLLPTSDVAQPLITPWEGPASFGPQLSHEHEPPRFTGQGLATAGAPAVRHGGEAACRPGLHDAAAAPVRRSGCPREPFAAGWDISLRFAPAAMNMMAAHQERCRESLRRRMACAVRLRFEQRGGRE